MKIQQETIPKISLRTQLVEIYQDFQETGYAIRAEIVDAVNYGVAQTRKRVFFLARRIEQPGGPLQETMAMQDVNAVWESFQAVKRKPLVLRDVIGHLPPLQAGDGFYVVRITDAQGRGQLLHNHETRPHNHRDLEMYSLLLPGETLKKARVRLGAEALNDYVIGSEQHFLDKFKKQHWDQPSSTIVAHMGRDGHIQAAQQAIADPASQLPVAPLAKMLASAN